MTQGCLKEAKLLQGSHAHHASRRELLGLMGVPGEKQGGTPGQPEVDGWSRLQWGKGHCV